MRSKPVLLWANSFVQIASSFALAQSTDVGDGIDYHQYTFTDPNVVFVARMHIANTIAFSESRIAK